MALTQCSYTRQFLTKVPKNVPPILQRSGRGVAVVMFAACVLLSAQNVVLTGSLSGRVSDPSGAIVPDAPIVLQNLATGVQQSAANNRV
jgi:hypothetical protein